ncbi:HzsA-related protein [Cellvibrio mixtus]|uniref:HzsA-related protein n=1 Tax=Cellvibrio mixtus TaxID=39650 RepID=UPI0006938A8E|nr:PD40 domain-containing protein [Cellvibrio mixtus]
MKREWGIFLSTFKDWVSRRSLTCVMLAGALAGCGGGGGSADGGQKPDPVVVDLPIAYVERPIPVDEDGNPVFPDVFDQAAFNPGARLLLKDRATALASPVDISSAAFPGEDFPVADYPDGPLYDVKDISVHPDGNRLVFAMRAPEIPGADEDRQPTWNIWEYHLQTKVLRRIISTDIVAEAGQDVSPRYLPDGRILFASTRQTRSKAILLDDGKPQYSAGVEGNRNRPAYVLHTMKDDGTDIQQITYNQSHDIQPGVLPDGRVFYTRWDRNGHNNLSFYTVNPDGTNSQIYYGYDSLNSEPEDATQSTPRLFNVNPMPDGRIAGILKPDGALLGGDMVVIDGARFSENERAVPGASGGEASGQRRISILPVNIREGENEISVHGRFASLYPLYDGTNRLLVSWSQCRLEEPVTLRLLPCTEANLAIPDIREAEPFYGIWIYNTAAQTQQPVVLAKDGVMYTDAVSLEKITPPTFLRPEVDTQLAQEAVGVLHIRSVYDIDGTFSRYGMAGAPADLAAMAAAPASARPARFLRLIKAVSMPDNDTLNFQGTAFGVSGNVMREILGYAPVEPDGSVKVKVPADVAFTIEVLDANGRRIGAVHNNWLQLRPGEVRECNGCHNNQNDVAHGRSDAEATALNKGAATSGVSFLNTLRFDALGTPITPNMGETMAEFATRSTFCLTPGNAATCAPVAQRAPSVDIVFNDEWTDPAVRPRDASFEYRYSALADDPAQIAAPTSEACMDPDGWNSLCRIIINYETHIQPLWERSRIVNGEERRCTGCHSRDAVDNNGNALVQIPAGQLELTRQPSDANNAHMTSYRELLTNDLRQVLTDDGAGLTDNIPVCEFEVDEDSIPECAVTLDAENNPTCEGVAVCPFVEQNITNEQGQVKTVLVLDGEGNPIPLTRQIGVDSSMKVGGARASAQFFGRFNNFNATTDTVDHRGFLNASELKLLSEWLDIRAAYYNNPFDSVD